MEPTRYRISISCLEGYGSNGTETAFMVAHDLQGILPEADGTVLPSYGFGEWGVEEGATIITTSKLNPTEMRERIRILLARHGQECAYVEYGGNAYEWTQAGEENPIEGYRGGS